MRMNISVPDALAEEVRRRDIAISAVCQRALREEVDRLQEFEAATDIQVYIAADQADPDPLTWPDFNPTMPHLVHRHAEPEGGGYRMPGWTLDYEENDVHCFIAGARSDIADVLDQARQWLRRAAGSEMEKITVEVGEPSLTIGFTGRWLVEPDPDETRGGSDAGAYWGVALTQRGRIAVYVAHVNDGWPASLNDYPSLDAAANDNVPEEIIVRAAAELGKTRVLWRDI
jgi:Post-segregation antitoxin CcdA